MTRDRWAVYALVLVVLMQSLMLHRPRTVINIQDCQGRELWHSQ